MIILMVKKGTFKKQDNKRKKEKCYNLGDNENEQLRKYKKEGKKSYVVEFLMMKKGTFKKGGHQKKKRKV